jgi:hypothetical protein
VFPTVFNAVSQKISQTARNRTEIPDLRDEIVDLGKSPEPGTIHETDIIFGSQGFKALFAILPKPFPTMRQVRSPNGRFMKEETEYHAGRLHGEAQYGISGAGL